MGIIKFCIPFFQLFSNYCIYMFIYFYYCMLNKLEFLFTFHILNPPDKWTASHISNVVFKSKHLKLLWEPEWEISQRWFMSYLKQPLIQIIKRFPIQSVQDLSHTCSRHTWRLLQCVTRVNNHNNRLSLNLSHNNKRWDWKPFFILIKLDQMYDYTCF